MDTDEMELVFENIMNAKYWGSEEDHKETVCGAGSTEDNTSSLRSGLESIIDLLKIKTLLDIPCGDFHWMTSVDLQDVKYIGGDIVTKMIACNNDKYRKDFRRLDITSSDLPKVDLILCRDCFGHLSFEDCELAIDNIQRSGSSYLLITTFVRKDNRDIPTGRWAARNMCRDPFCFPPPLITLDEMCVEYFPGFVDKSLGLWKVSDL